MEFRPDQSASPDLTIDFDHSQNLSLWDYDDVSRDDHLGSITIEAAEVDEGDTGRLAHSRVEGSLYYMVYRVS